MFQNDCALFQEARALLDADAAPLLNRLGDVTAHEQLRVARASVRNFSHRYIRELFTSPKCVRQVETRLLVELLISKGWCAALLYFHHKKHPHRHELELLGLLVRDACTYDSAYLLNWALDREGAKCHSALNVCATMVAACKRGPRLFGADLRTAPEFERDRPHIDDEYHLMGGAFFCADVLIVLLARVSEHESLLQASLGTVAAALAHNYSDLALLERCVQAVAQCVERVRDDLPWTQQELDDAYFLD